MMPTQDKVIADLESLEAEISELETLELDGFYPDLDRRTLIMEKTSAHNNLLDYLKDGK